MTHIDCKTQKKNVTFYIKRKIYFSLVQFTMLCFLRKKTSMWCLCFRASGCSFEGDKDSVTAVASNASDKAERWRSAVEFARF
jgi:hypothetical protein